ncbi:hypothetical protein M409DRAFT_29485 [Zasmidium cellare ATCC 36951]|uniref:Uncharacterized protein n=1 Tax=Zasmidium cellare ATCC 36951 TaxID=1080233 RepID=A0A6A6BZI5_ZASCE|nr:uncharacterized protein M409DRAFT_29485 [Zasmidium cellare ATCC 36951]KAF2160033.1 hypothetical protein M409DRAFT_29485 [Zasmidium cellare ATCC 36951]
MKRRHSLAGRERDQARSSKRRAIQATASNDDSHASDEGLAIKLGDEPTADLTTYVQAVTGDQENIAVTQLLNADISHIICAWESNKYGDCDQKQVMQAFGGSLEDFVKFIKNQENEEHQQGLVHLFADVFGKQRQQANLSVCILAEGLGHALGKRKLDEFLKKTEFFAEVKDAAAKGANIRKRIEGARKVVRASWPPAAREHPFIQWFTGGNTTEQRAKEFLTFVNKNRDWTTIAPLLSKSIIYRLQHPGKGKSPDKRLMPIDLKAIADEHEDEIAAIYLQSSKTIAWLGWRLVSITGDDEVAPNPELMRHLRAGGNLQPDRQASTPDQPPQKELRRSSRQSTKTDLVWPEQLASKHNSSNRLADNPKPALTPGEKSDSTSHLRSTSLVEPPNKSSTHKKSSRLGFAVTKSTSDSTPTSSSPAIVPDDTSNDSDVQSEHTDQDGSQYVCPELNNHDKACPHDVEKRLIHIVQDAHIMVSDTDQQVQYLQYYVAQREDRDEPPLCHKHLRLFKGRVFGFQNNKGSREDHDKALMRMHSKGLADLDRYRHSNGHLFTRASLPDLPSDVLGPYRFQTHQSFNKTKLPLSLDEIMMSESSKFNHARDAIWQRLGLSTQDWEAWEKDGNLITGQIFHWWKDFDYGSKEHPNLLALAMEEIAMYRWHQRNVRGKSNIGWGRSMVHGLCQQLMRMDPCYWLLYVCCRPDSAVPLVSYSYYCKDQHPAVGKLESNLGKEFRHLDFNIENMNEEGGGKNMAQGSLSLRDEERDDCTILIPKMHVPSNWNEWTSRLLDRRDVTSAKVEDIDSTM